MIATSTYLGSTKMISIDIILISTLLALFVTVASAHGQGHGHHTNASNGGFDSVRYDHRSLIINGHRELIFSGSIHYPRSTPDMWPILIKKARRGGLNTIQTYVFWNVHEPRPGKYDFDGNNDLVKFLKEAQRQGMWVILRIGPFIQAEWNFGGFPCWLREVPNILFRTDNGPFKSYMERFVNVIVNLMKKEKLFINQGGPIIVAQIENEYNNIAAAYKEDGTNYIKWAANMAVGFQVGVPWVMCKQRNAPDTVISACNGRNCGDTFEGPGSPHKPTLWTENWTAQYRVFGDPPSQRSAEDLAYSIARFFSKGGSLANYYMYHGGTNFGRTGAAFVLTRYYDEAPLDEIGLHKEPKWGHLKDLHSALRLAKKALLWGKSHTQQLGRDLEARVFEKKNSKVCVAFLSNNNSRVDYTTNFRGTSYFLPRRSVSILPDCKTVVYNTHRVNAQHNARTYHLAKESNDGKEWKMWQEELPTIDYAEQKFPQPNELIGITKDVTDYLWYTTKFALEDQDLPMRHDIRPVLQLSNLGHVMHMFVNGDYVGTGHGKKIDKSFTMQIPVPLKKGMNHISLLGMTVGLPDSGAYLEHRMAGLHTVTVQGLNTGTLDLTHNTWGHTVGLQGEKNDVFTEEGCKKVKWSKATKYTPITWYKKYFDAPHGGDPVALDMSTMGKGLAWVNGKGIGRYWVSYKNPLGKPSQTMYHIPRAFLKNQGNLLVVFEEHGGDPEGMAVMTVKRDNICTKVSEFHPARVKSWKRENAKFQAAVEDVKPRAMLRCTGGKLIKEISFASFGNPGGVCGNLTIGSCHSEKAKFIAEKACVGKGACLLPVMAEDYDADRNCPDTLLTLSVQAKCSRRKRVK